MAAPAPERDPKKGKKRRWLGEKPLRTSLRIGAALAGASIVGFGLASLWPKADRVAPALPSANDPTSLAPFPRQPVVVMVVGLDSNRINDPVNQAAPMGPANADSVMLIRVEPKRPLQILQVPTELGVNLPGNPSMQPLATSYLQGGVALTADVVADVVGLEEGAPSRYVVMPRQALRSLVSGLGDVDVRLNQTLVHTDQSQNYSVNLQAGRQTLNGLQAEQLVRFRPDPHNNHERRLRQQWLVRAIHEQLLHHTTMVALPGLIQNIEGQVQSNLSSGEWFSLAAAIMSSDQPPVVTTLPLATRAGEQSLRQIKPDAPSPLWPSN